MNKIRNVIIIALFVISVIIISKNKKKYSIDENISNYNLNNEKMQYLDYLKGFLKPIELQKFVENGFINLSLYESDATGHDVIKELYYEAYENLFKYVFDKTTSNFDDCPVTSAFKSKFNTNLIQYLI